VDIGRRITAWREAKGLSQRKLAALVGVTPQAVCMWEKEATWQNVPSTRNLTKLVAVFGITMERFYGEVPKPKKKAAA
jgi:transcriptional regulator with XRE-family HTH domain